jgi:hypothetical protein
LIIFLIASVLSCSRKSEEAEGSEPSSMDIDTSPSAMISSSAAVENNKDTTRKFIRTAELKFKVKSVVEATNDIERIIGSYGGFVTYTELKSSVNHVQPMQSVKTHH